jgi:hypothetical protein
MAKRLCPHCGTELPSIRDGFCPECRNDLDEDPTLDLPPPDPAQRARNRRLRLVFAGYYAWHMVAFWAVLIGILAASIVETACGRPTITLVLWALAGVVLLWESMRRYFRPAKVTVPLDKVDPDGGESPKP